MGLKVKAYTLFEIIISMVIMSVISLIVFVLFSSFLRQLHFYNDTSSEISNYAFLKNNLKREFYQAQKISSNTINTITFEMDNNQNISYSFSKNHIIKKINKTIDTLTVKLSDFNIETNQNEQVTALKLDCLLFEEPISTIFYKKHSNSININALLNEN